MTATESALLAAICDPANHADDGVRLVYADWLEDNAGAVPCPGCGGTTRHRITLEGRQYQNTVIGTCATCRGSGTASDGRRERAEFVRSQIESARLIARVELWTTTPGESVVGSGEAGAALAAAQRLQRRADDLYAARGDEWHPADGLEWEWRRGFPTVLRGPLAAFWGEREGPCDGCNREGAACVIGTVSGPTPALIAVVAANPVERVEVVGKRPVDADREWHWFAENEYAPGGEGVLPGDLFDLLPVECEYIDSDMQIPFKRFPSEAAARDALSDAILGAARAAAKGVTP